MDMRSLLLSAASFAGTTLIGQNLVGNGDFEDFDDCPTYYNQVERCIGWFRSSANNDPQYHTEYLNACNTGSFFSAPGNTWGYQEPLSGEGYMALCTMSPEIFEGYRENIYTELLAPTEIGMSYTVRVSISHTDNSQFASNNFGVKLSTSANFAIDNECQFALADLVMNKTGWTTLTATFIADQVYTHLALGNFMTDDNTITTQACPSCAYDLFGYYVDDVCLVKSDLNLCTACQEDFGPSMAIDNPGLDELPLSPTLIGADMNEVRIRMTDAVIAQVEVFDMEGRLVRSVTTRSNGTAEIATSGLANATYSVVARAADGRKLTGRFVVAR